MKKIAWLLMLTLVCGMLHAQSTKEIFDAALVPNAPIVVYADGSSLQDTPFVQLAKKYEVELQALVTTNAAKATGEGQMKMKEFWDSVKKDLGLADDDVVKWQASVSLGGIQFGAGEPDFGQLDILLVAELKKALNPEQVKTALLAADKKCGDGDAEDKADLTVAERNGAKLKRRICPPRYAACSAVLSATARFSWPARRRAFSPLWSVLSRRRPPRSIRTSRRCSMTRNTASWPSVCSRS